MTGALENQLFRRRRTIPAAFALLTLAMGWRAAGLRVDAGFTKPVPVKHEYMETFLQYRDEFGGADRVLIAVMARDGRAPFGIRISETKVNDLAHSWAGGADDARTIFGAIGEAGPSYIHVNAHRGFEPVFGTGKSLARGEAPVAFDPAMLRPYATLENVSEWRAGKGPG